MNERGKLEVNAFVFPLLGLLMLGLGGWSVVAGVQALRNAKESGPVFHRQAFDGVAGSPMTLEISALPLPSGTRRIGIELWEKDQGKGTFLAEARVSAGATPWTGENSWHNRYKGGSSGTWRIGIAPVTGDTAALRVKLTPPPGGKILQAQAILIANPADERESDGQGSVFLGVLFGSIGAIFLAVGLVLRKKLKENPLPF